MMASSNDDQHRGDLYRGVPREEDRLQELQNFELKWKAVNLLRPQHKLAIKQYYSLKQGRDDGTALCHFCKKAFGFKELEIHHIDHSRENNQLTNVTPACRTCNEDDKAIWMSEQYRRTHATEGSGITPKEKENVRTPIAESEQARLIKQAPLTTQLKIRYKMQTLDHMLQHVKKQTLAETVYADVEALTECSHAKALEYVDSYCNSALYSPFRKWITYNEDETMIGEWIAPRMHGDKPSPAYAKVLEEYQKRKQESST